MFFLMFFPVFVIFLAISIFQNCAIFSSAASPPSPCFSSLNHSAAFIWVGGPRLLTRLFLVQKTCPCPPEMDTFSVDFFNAGMATADVDENYWTGMASLIQMPYCRKFCICDERGECFEPANGTERIGHAEFYPFCDEGGCHLYFLFESASLADALLLGDLGTRLNSSAQFRHAKWGSPLPLGSKSPYLKARAAGCAGCQFIRDYRAQIKGQCLF